MFARGLRDEGLQQLYRTSQAIDSCDASRKSGVGPLDQEPNRSLASLTITQRLVDSDRIVEVNNMACSLYENGSIDESLEKLRMFVPSVMSEVYSSADDAAHRSLATILRNMSHIYYVKGLYVKALVFAKEAVACNKSDDDELSASL